MEIVREWKKEESEKVHAIWVNNALLFLSNFDYTLDETIYSIYRGSTYENSKWLLSWG